MMMHSKLMDELDVACEANSLVIVTKGAVMLPLGSQVQNVLGTEPDAVVEAVTSALQQRGDVVWGHGSGTKLELLGRAFAHLPHTAQWRAILPEDQPAPLQVSLAEASVGFESLTAYIGFSNSLKLSNPKLPVCNYYDTGLTVCVVQGWTVDAGISLLTDRDGLAMLREGSIGQTISKLNQLLKVSPLKDQRGVYNVFVGDGASRLSGGLELAMDHVKVYGAASMVNLFVFQNEKWAVEDNLVGGEKPYHHLQNMAFYDAAATHARVTVAETVAQLANTLDGLSRLQLRYIAGDEPPALRVVVVRNLDAKLPPLVGDLRAIRNSPEMWFLRETLGQYANGAAFKIPIYGCSAFEFIQYLDHFVSKTTEGQAYEYICGHTDIQAAHMAGFEQPEGRCVLFINDVYGTHGLGEALRFVQSGLGGKQLLIFIWHPSMTKVIDNFQPHRPCMVWPSMGPEVAKYYVRKTSDALFVDFDGAQSTRVVDSVKQGMANGTPLIVVNMLPEGERNAVALDIRASAYAEKQTGEGASREEG